METNKMEAVLRGGELKYIRGGGGLSKNSILIPFRLLLNCQTKSVTRQL